MIVCQCNGISDTEIHAAIDWMRAADPTTLITPGKVYRALGKAADCGGCLPLFLVTMRGNKKIWKSLSNSATFGAEQDRTTDHARRQ